jgi:transcriptional regulator with XRE-family HTH domain
MATRTRAIDNAKRRWDRQRREIGDELRAARLILGVTQRAVAHAAGVSQSVVSRRERGRARQLTGAGIATHAAAVGLALSVKLWPAGGGIRDEAQARYIARFVARVGRAWRVQLEAPVPISGDLRAADILLTSRTLRIAVEVITRLSDLQAQLRAARAKARDLGAGRLVIVVAATHANRRALAVARGALVATFDMDSQRVLSQLAAGRDPGRDAIVMLA